MGLASPESAALPDKPPDIDRKRRTSKGVRRRWGSTEAIVSGRVEDGLERSSSCVQQGRRLRWSRRPQGWLSRNVTSELARVKLPVRATEAPARYRCHLRHTRATPGTVEKQRQVVGSDVVSDPASKLVRSKARRRHSPVDCINAVVSGVEESRLAWVVEKDVGPALQVVPKGDAVDVRPGAAKRRVASVEVPEDHAPV